MSAVKRKNVFYFDDIARSAKKTKLSNEKKKEPVEEEVDFEAQELDELLALVDELPEMPQLDKGELEVKTKFFLQNIFLPQHTFLRRPYQNLNEPVRKTLICDPYIPKMRQSLWTVNWP